MRSLERKAWIALALVFCAFLSACGTPGVPQPPSLNLPDPVQDLSAVRAGNIVTLTWTMPRHNTDKTILKSDVSARLCRREGTGECIPIGTEQKIAPGNPGRYEDTLTNALASGQPRPLRYFVELPNRRSRSAGPSNAATVLAGEAPRPIEGLKAEVRKQGVVLSWTADGESTPVRLARKLQTPAPIGHNGAEAKGGTTSPAMSPGAVAQKDLMSPSPEPINQNFMVDEASKEARALDKTARLHETYEYRAQRVSRVDVDGQIIELASELSPPVDVEVKDVFPPNVPTGLAAVATLGDKGASPAIDLSWQPGAETELAGYVVYRREGDGSWQKISPESPSIEPAFHDAQVQPGHTYHYAVSAVSKGGQESERSAEAQETVPQP
jgi:hypothetical protein